MGRAERKRWDKNDRVQKLLTEAQTRLLTSEELEEIREGYSGYGGLHGWTFGQFFTPRTVTTFIVDLLNIAGGKILEPSCGAGAFLEPLPAGCEVEAFEHMQEAAEVARLLYPSAKVITGNTLTHLSELEGRFDYVIGNPPFCDVQKHEQYPGYAIAEKGRGRAEWYFMELGLRALKPGGVMAFVLPDGILSDKKSMPLRRWIMDEMAWVRASISLPPETFKMTGTTVKTSVLVLQKKVPGVDLGDYGIFMAMIENIGWDSRGRATGKCDFPEIHGAWMKMYPHGLPTAAELLLPSEGQSIHPIAPKQTLRLPVQPSAAGRWQQMALGF